MMRPVMFARGLEKEAATHICTEDKATPALWHHMKDVFSQRVQQIQLFTFSFFFFPQKDISQIFKKEDEFCASCHSDWSAQWAGGSSGGEAAEGRVHI